MINSLCKVIAAEGEHKASRALRHAAEVIIDSPAALQVVSSFYRIQAQNHAQTQTQAQRNTDRERNRHRQRHRALETQ